MVYARAYSAAHRAPGRHRPLTRAIMEVMEAMLGASTTAGAAQFQPCVVIVARNAAAIAGEIARDKGGSVSTKSTLAAGNRGRMSRQSPCRMRRARNDFRVQTAPIFALVNQVFGRGAAPVIVSLIFAGHQVGAMAAARADIVRSMTEDYLLAFVTSGFTCLIASLLACGLREFPPSQHHLQTGSGAV